MLASGRWHGINGPDEGHLRRKDAMSDIPLYFERLDDALLDLPEDTDAMTASEVDGFVAGLALMPVPVPEDEWLPLIWRPFPETPDYLYHDQELLDEIAGLARQHLRHVARDLHRNQYEPLIDYMRGSDEPLWEIWMEGFARAMALRGDAFEEVENANEDARAALGTLLALNWIATETEAAAATEEDGETAPAGEDGIADDAFLTPELKRELIAEAPGFIADSVATLYDWTRDRRPTPDFAVPVRSQKVGRNDPCPCGSGLKFKKCCGKEA